MSEDYLAYWRTDAPVFLRPVAGDQLYVPPGLAPGLARLLAFCQRNQSLVMVVGEPGTGKSTLLKWLFMGLPTDSHEILLTTMVRKERSAGWLTPRIAELMGLSPAAGPKTDNVAELLFATAARMDELIAEQRKLVVAIDCAHLADGPEAFAEVVAFLNLQALAGTCLSFLLCGDTALAAHVEATPELASKLAFSLTVPRLAPAETTAYIDHRLALAGVTAPFDSDAVDVIHARSRGALAPINALAETCLLETCLRQGRRVTVDVALAACQYSGPGASTPSARTLPLRAGSGGSLSAPQPRAAEPVPGARPEAPAAAGTPAGAAAAAADGAAIKLTSLFKNEPGRS